MILQAGATVSILGITVMASVDRRAPVKDASLTLFGESSGNRQAVAQGGIPGAC